MQAYAYSSIIPIAYILLVPKAFFRTTNHLLKARTTYAFLCPFERRHPSFDYHHIDSRQRNYGDNSLSWDSIPRSINVSHHAPLSREAFEWCPDRYLDRNSHKGYPAASTANI